MTYTIFEGLKEKVKEILEAQTEEAVIARVEKITIADQVLNLLYKESMVYCHL